ncbi:HIT domain-containing protein [Arenicella sp. 4NH20-0111]|uniref:HIT domain-containing protein n=1 Tax=Arenicella sp. 4NH20-0111 TaxID=3127648 RepID=UPI0031070092
MYKLDSRLSEDTLKIGTFNLCDALLMNNSLLPWVILVPRRTGIREIYELNEADQFSLLNESMLVSKTLMTEFKGDKLNTAAIGNIVPQLHLHHVIRYQYDSAWPKPVWGNIPAKPYTQTTSKQALKKFRTLFTNASGNFVSN